MTLEEILREKVVEEALSWVRTPYHHMGRVKGRYGGVDCATLLLEVYARAGVIDPIKVDHYPLDWYLHRSEEKYLSWLTRFARPVSSEPRRGDVEVYRFGRCVSHAAIILDYPEIVHAWSKMGCVCEDNASRNTKLSGRGRGIYRYVGWGD